MWANCLLNVFGRNYLYETLHLEVILSKIEADKQLFICRNI